jgi:phytanoyl-CoA hydroxylase
MSATLTSTVSPVHLRTEHLKQEVLPKCLKNLTGNALDESDIGWLKETPVTMSIDAMKERYLEDGYVFLKSLIPRDDVLDVREEYAPGEHFILSADLTKYPDTFLILHLSGL